MGSGLSPGKIHNLAETSVRKPQRQHCSGKSRSFGVRQPWACFWVYIYVTLGKSGNLSEPRWPCLRNGSDDLSVFVPVMLSTW